MKVFFLLLLSLPVLAVAQVKPKNQTKSVTKNASQVKAKTVPASSKIVPVRDSYIINGNVTGFPEGTTVSVLNGQTGAAEATAKMMKNKFVLQGKVMFPDFKLLCFNNQPPYITMLLDNSEVKVTGKKEALDSMIIIGSQSNYDFRVFNELIGPYSNVFDPEQPYDSLNVQKAMLLTSEFALQRPKSYVSALAVIRYNQLVEDPSLTEKLFYTIDTAVQNSPFGAYIKRMLEESKNNAIGSILADFTQTDTAGVAVSLSSFRGKYVLIDFWASWCGPCRRENPNVVATYNKYKNKNFAILGVSLDKGKPEWIDAIAADKLQWTQVSDLAGFANAAALQYKIYKIPDNILLDPQGRVVAKNLRGPALERRLQRLLN